jgi:hypothetical protein
MRDIEHFMTVSIIGANMLSVTFDTQLRQARTQIMTLTRAIGTAEYLDAWCAGCELHRILFRAEQCAESLPLDDRQIAIERLNSIKAIALPILELAPSPSEMALRQARSTDWMVDRSEWLREERAWVARSVRREETSAWVHRSSRRLSRDVS